MRLEKFFFHFICLHPILVVSAIYMSTYIPLKFVLCTIYHKIHCCIMNTKVCNKNEDITKLARYRPKPMQHAGLGTAPVPQFVLWALIRSQRYQLSSALVRDRGKHVRINPVGLGIGRFQCRFHIPQCVKQSIFLFSCWMATRICFTKKVKVSTENRILMKTPSNTKPGTLTSRCFPVSEHREHSDTCLVNLRHPCLQCFCRVQYCYMTKWLRCVHYCYVTRDSLFLLGEQNPENLDHWVGNSGHWVGDCPPS